MPTPPAALPRAVVPCNPFGQRPEGWRSRTRMTDSGGGAVTVRLATGRRLPESGRLVRPRRFQPDRRSLNGLINGLINGHVRRDVAVPVYLQAAGVPASDIDAVAYLEPGGATPAGGYDRIERAPAPTREDPCAPFKR